VPAAIEVVSGRERKTYTLTDKGRQAFSVGVDAWMEVTDALLETKRLASKVKRGCEC
jgi:PadR family transcriptional regulator PadR